MKVLLIVYISLLTQDGMQGAVKHTMRTDSIEQCMELGKSFVKEYQTNKDNFALPTVDIRYECKV